MTCFALCDVNNMYVSCERVFQPRLNGQPVVTLSSNDGVAVARSNEAKALGVKMAQPFFEIRHLEREAGLIAMSANFELYTDMSRRMVSIARKFAPRCQQYSVDEVFLSYDGADPSAVGPYSTFTDLGHALRSRMLRWIGLPSSVGFASTKTLAKLANHIAKSADRGLGGYPRHLAQVCDFNALSARELEALFAATPVNDVWGIGRKISAKLNEAGISTVSDLVHADSATLRKRFNVVVEKTVRELRGISCLDIDDVPAAKQQIMVSRSFGSAVPDLPSLVSAVSEFASRATEKARAQGSAAGAVTVFVMTSPFRAQDRQHSPSTTLQLVRPTNDTTQIVTTAVRGLREIYRSGHRYAKCGVMLIDLRPQELSQGELDLFGGGDEPEPPAHREPARDRTRLMTAMDALNRRFGRGSVTLASSGLGTERGSWATRQERKSPAYTTSWEEIPVVRA